MQKSLTLTNDNNNRTAAAKKKKKNNKKKDKIEEQNRVRPKEYSPVRTKGKLYRVCLHTEITRTKSICLRLVCEIESTVFCVGIIFICYKDH